MDNEKQSQESLYRQMTCGCFLMQGIVKMRQTDEERGLDKADNYHRIKDIFLIIHEYNLNPSARAFKIFLHPYLR